MKVERWRRLESLYNQAVEMEEGQRTAFLREACGDDEDLRRNLEELFAEEPRLGSFLEKAALREFAHEFAATGDSSQLSWIGRHVGNYEFLSLLGVGGMGEVYRVRDSKLKRDVAIKVLPDEFSRDPDRISRFEREAQLLASLNHPNIAAIYDLEESSGIRLLILELIPGETLADRIQRGPIPVEEALKLAIQIVEALEAAHDKSVIHRDLKPANIKVTVDGKVKVLDFGLAKALLGDAGVDLSNAPTVSLTATQQGVIMGTAAYMSPEQAHGQAVDKRADIWSFGCVLYEMLTGRQTFLGEGGQGVGGGVPAILASVLKSEPDWDRLPEDTPAAIRRLLRRCLRKDRNHRLQTVGDARIEIEEAANEPQMDGDAMASGVSSRSRPGWTAWTAVVLAVLITVVLVIWNWRGPVVSTAAEARLELNTPQTTEPVSLAMSPDGQKIVYVAGSEEQSLWIRLIDSGLVQPLAGTDGATFPFWSPNSRSVAFFAQGKLKRIDTASGFVETLAGAVAGRGGSWGPDGTIIFSASPASPILRLPPAGGEPVQITQLELLHHGGHRFPQFFPDGKHFLYYAQGSSQGIYIGELDGAERRLWLDTSDTFGGSVWFSSGKVLFVRDGTLFGQDFDPVRIEVKGNSFLVAAAPPGTLLIRALSASTDGRIAFRMAPAGGGPRQLGRFDRSGKEIGKIRGLHYGIEPELSRDGRFVSMRTNQNGNTDITLLAIDGSATTRFTFDPKIDDRAIWSPDGRRIAFSSNRKGVYSIYWKLTTGLPASEELLLETGRPSFPLDWSRDGRFLLFNQHEKLSNSDLLGFANEW